MLKLTQTQLRAVLLARGDDPRPFTKALWITDRFVMCTNGQRMHLFVHGQEWPHGNIAVPLMAVLLAPPLLPEIAIDRGSVCGKPFLPVMGATLPPVDKFLPDLPAPPATGVIRCAIGHEYLRDAQEAIALMLGDGQDDCLHMTDAGVWTWCNGQFLVCVAPMQNLGYQTQLKGLE